MKHLRAISKAFGFCLWTGGLYSLWWLGGLWLTERTGAARRWRNFIFRAWARGMARLMRMQLTVRGMPPSPPFLLVANHLSYVDVIALATQLDCVLVGKSELARWPVLGRMARGMNTIFVDRDKRRALPRVNAAIDECLRAGQSVVFFPEGTSTRGAEVLPFKPNLLEAAARSEVPVAVASLHYRTRADEAPADESVCWWGEMAFLPHLYRLFQLTEIITTVSFGAEVLRAADRKQLAEQAHAAVCRIFTPVTATPVAAFHEPASVCTLICQPNL